MDIITVGYRVGKRRGVSMDRITVGYRVGEKERDVNG